MQVVEPLISVVAAMEVNFLPVHCSRVIIAAGGFGAESFGFRPTNQVVQIKHIKVIQRLFSIPAAKDVQEIGHLVAGMCSSTAGWIVLRKWGIPSH